VSKQKKLFGDIDVEVRKNIPLEEAKKFADKMLMEMSLNDDQFEIISRVGSIRRKKETVNDIDFVVITSDKGWLQLRGYFLGELKAKKVCAGDKIQRYILDRIEFDIYRATIDNFGITKLIRTGSAEHNIYLAKLAIRKGMRIKYSQGIVKGKKVIASVTETNIFRALGLPFIEPELREIVKGKPVWEGKL